MLFQQTFTTLPLIMAADGHSPAAYGTMALNGIGVVVGQPLAVRFLANRDPSVVLAGSMLLVGVGVGADLGPIAHGGVGQAGSVLVWTLGQIGVAVMFGAVFAGLAPADLRGRYLGVASATWGFGAVFSPLAGIVLLNYAGRAALAAACMIAGIVLFASQLVLRPILRRRTAAQGESDSNHPRGAAPDNW